MTRDEVRAVAGNLRNLHSRYASCFGRKEAQKHSLVYLRGLLLSEGRKNVERIALRFVSAGDGSPAGQNAVVALQEFLTLSPWQPGDAFFELKNTPAGCDTGRTTSFGTYLGPLEHLNERCCTAGPAVEPPSLPEVR